MSEMEEIPVIDLKKQYQSIRPELDAVFARVLEKGAFILGSEVSAFEKEFAEYCGATHAIGVASGTDALQLALMACEIGENDEVAVPAHTAVATVSAVEAGGAHPLLVDVDSANYTLDPNLLPRILTPRTRAVIPVHLYGCPVDMEPVLEFAQKNHLFVIEDCSQAHGASYRGRKIGTWGDIAAFSFYPTKNLGAFGDGGMVVTNNDALAEKVRLLRQYGWGEHYVSSIRGINSRLDELQAGILRVKLHHLDGWNTRRRQFAELYRNLLSGTDLVLPAQNAGHVYHQFVIRHPQRDSLREYLKENGISTLIHYPVPVHFQPAYADLGYTAGSLPVTERASREVLSLPLYPELTEEKVMRICQTILDFFTHST